MVKQIKSKEVLLSTSAPIAQVESAPTAPMFRLYLGSSATRSVKPSKKQRERGLPYGRWIVGGASNGLWLEREVTMGHGTEPDGRAYVDVSASVIERVIALKERLGIELSYVELPKV